MNLTARRSDFFDELSGVGVVVFHNFYSNTTTKGCTKKYKNASNNPLKKESIYIVLNYINFYFFYLGNWNLKHVTANKNHEE